MVKYAQNELFSITDFTKQIGSAVSNIKEHTLEKIGILKNNKLEAVVISTDEYECLKELEEQVSLAEHSSIYDALQERRELPLSEYMEIGYFVPKIFKEEFEKFTQELQKKRKRELLQKVLKASRKDVIEEGTVSDGIA